MVYGRHPKAFITVRKNVRPFLPQMKCPFFSTKVTNSEDSAAGANKASLNDVFEECYQC